jgi:hypothetical protein
VNRDPVEVLALITLALLALTAGAASATRAARREGKTLREWWDGLR